MDRLGLQLIQQIERISSFEVHFIDEHNDRRVAHAANFHQPLGLRLHPFHAVNDQNNTVHSGKRAIGVLRKILVTGSIEQIDLLAEVFEYHHRSGHRNTALAFDLHEVRRCGLGDLVALHRAGCLDGSTKKEQLLRESRFPGIGVRDNSEGSPSLDFVEQVHGYGQWGAKVNAGSPARGIERWLYVHTQHSPVFLEVSAGIHGAYQRAVLSGSCGNGEYPCRILENMVAGHDHFLLPDHQTGGCLQNEAH